MSRKLIVVGNGLGMAIAPEQFGLKPVMQRVWREGLEEDERKLLAKHFRDIDEDNGPSEERHLMVAQVAVMMPELVKCKAISKADNLADWFSTPWGLEKIKAALDKFSFKIAHQLAKASMVSDIKGCWEGSKACKSLEDLQDFHLVTLNYDYFLYETSFAHLTDGFRGEKEGCFPLFTRSHRYLHLHGSPLYKSNITKAKRGNELSEQSCTHIILSDGALKPLLIARSEILSAYWKELENILLNEDTEFRPEEIILFGYGGGDDHLNRLIGESKYPVRVVERRKGHNIPDQEKVWKKRLSDDTDVIVDLRKNILTFDKWATRPAESKMENDA